MQDSEKLDKTTEGKKRYKQKVINQRASKELQLSGCISSEGQGDQNSRSEPFAQDDCQEHLQFLRAEQNRREWDRICVNRIHTVTCSASMLHYHFLVQFADDNDPTEIKDQPTEHFAAAAAFSRDE